MARRERRTARRAALAVALLMAAALLCLASPKKTGIPDDPFVSREASPPPADRSRPAARATVPAPPKLPYPACPAPPGVIYRAQLDRILERSPGVFLKGVDVARVTAADLPGGKPFWKGGQARPSAAFGGWRILRFHPGDPCLGRTGLQRGDIVAEVNGSPLQRPDDLARLWKTLRSAPRIVIKLYRQGRPLVFAVKIARARPSR